MNFYVYAHYKPNEFVPFYIGKGKKWRAWDKNNRNKHWNNIVKKYGYRTEIMYDNLSEALAFQIEKDFIKMYGRADLGCGPLVNMTEGGEGETYTNLGRKHTEKAKENMSKARRGLKCSEESNRRKKIFMMGHFVSEETKKKVSNSLKKVMGGKNNPMFGKKHSEESIRKMRIAKMKIVPKGDSNEPVVTY